MHPQSSAIIRNHPQSVRSANVGAAPAHDSHSYGRSKSSRWGAVFICSMFVKFGSWNGRYGRLWQMLQRNWMEMNEDGWRWEATAVFARDRGESPKAPEGVVIWRELAGREVRWMVCSDASEKEGQLPLASWVCCTRLSVLQAFQAVQRPQSLK